MGKRICMGCMESYDEKVDVCPYCGYVVDTPPKEAYHLTPGMILHKRYIVGKVIGYGGFGITYIGYDALLNMKVAIKEYLPGEFGTRAPGTAEVTVFTGDKEEQFQNGIIKFVDEAKRLAQFNNTSGIVSVFDTFEENNTAYIVMEYLEGETLKTMLDREEKIDINDALSMMLPIISALKEVHKKGILHRDISPDNIFITNKGEVKLIDFGAARYATTTHSKSLSVIVKPGYAPQEQYRSRGDQGPWTDVYACAATLYKMITGITPDDSMERGTKDTLVTPSKLGIDIPQNKENAIMNALNLEIQDRIQDMDSFEADLTTEGEVKRNKIRLKKMDIGKWPLWLKITSGTAAVAIVTFAVLLLTGVINWGSLNIFDKRTTVHVPNVLNYSEEEAEEIANEKGLVFVIAGKEESDVISNGMILSQTIPAGTEVEENMKFEVVISAGKGTAHMPDVTGLSKEEAKRMLEELGFQVVFNEGESEIADGYIYSQEYEEGKALEKGTEIALSVSTGNSSYDENKNTKIPDVEGLDWNKAREKAENKKVLIYKANTEESETVKKGVVISQDTKAKTKVPQGTAFGVDVSLGIVKTYVPDVEYKSLEAATSLLNEAKLNVNIEYQESDKVEKDHVISQSIEADTEVDAWTTVTIYVSLGNDKINQAKEYKADTTSEENTKESTTDTEKATTEKATTEKATTEKATTEKPTTEKTTTEKATTEKATTEQPTTEQPTTEKPTTEATTQQQLTTERPTITVPNVVGKEEASAKSEFLEAGLNVGDIVYMSSSGSSTGTVLNQGIASGTKVDAGTSISLIVCDNTKKTQYRYRTITSYKEKTSTTSKNAPSGYTYDRTETSETYGSWGGWSGWSPNGYSSSDTQEVESASGAVFGKYTNSSGEQNDKPANGKYPIREEVYYPWSWMVDKGTPWTSTHIWDTDASRVGFSTRYYRGVSGTGEWTWSGTVYRRRTRTKTVVNTYYFKKPVYSSWSSWSDSKPGSSSNREIDTREVYVYDSYN